MTSFHASVALFTLRPGPGLLLSFTTWLTQIHSYVNEMISNHSPLPTESPLSCGRGFLFLFLPYLDFHTSECYTISYGNYLHAKHLQKRSHGLSIYPPPGTSHNVLSKCGWNQGNGETFIQYTKPWLA